jgi:hypothetical protein
MARHAKRHEVLQFVRSAVTTRNDVMRLDLALMLIRELGVGVVLTLDAAVLADPVVTLVHLATTASPVGMVKTAVVLCLDAALPVW